MNDIKYEKPRQIAVESILHKKLVGTYEFVLPAGFVSGDSSNNYDIPAPEELHEMYLWVWDDTSPITVQLSLYNLVDLKGYPDTPPTKVEIYEYELWVNAGLADISQPDPGTLFTMGDMRGRITTDSQVPLTDGFTLTLELYEIK
jgi:hypothetical protein